MTIRALDLLIDSGLITSSGNIIDLKKLSSQEISSRVSHYINGRKQTATFEINEFNINEKLNGQFSTCSSKITRSKILSSMLIYDSIIVDDPIVTSSNNINIEYLLDALNFFSWSFKLIEAQFIKVLPISFFNEPSSIIPLFSSENSFKENIPDNIHDFAHSKVKLKPVIFKDKNYKNAYVLNEDANVKRSSTICVQFENDFITSAVNHFKHAKITDYKTNSKGELIVTTSWSPHDILSKDEFESWSYQAINQALMKRLEYIYNETYLSNSLGYTYITESKFESEILSISGIKGTGDLELGAKFLEANNIFINIESPDIILNLREKNSLAFNRFNSTLRSLSEQLSGLDDNDRKI